MDPLGWVLLWRFKAGEGEAIDLLVHIPTIYNI